MESWRLSFPKVTDVDIVFGGYPQDWFDAVLGQDKPDHYHRYADLMEELFFSGGTVPINKSLPDEYLRAGLRVFKAILGSFTPKHEHKEKVCALILNSLCE